MKINIKGPIIPNRDAWIYEWLEIEATSPKSVNYALEKANGEDVEVEINSGGGSVFAGSEIYTALKSYKGNVNVRIVGLAASAASVIAMAGKKIIISPTAQIMIHNASMYAEGDYRDMEHTAEILKNTNETIANAYKIKTGKSQEELLNLMNNETWLTPSKAKTLGFVDEIMFEEDMQDLQLVASANFSGILPKETIDKIRNTIKHPTKAKSDFLTTKYNYLKLKGECKNDIQRI